MTNITPAHLEAAIEREILTRDQADRLTALANQSSQSAATDEDERFRILNGLNDVFLSLGILLIGMLAPRNLGPEYGAQFDPIFPRLADRHGVAFYPFFLDGVAGKAELNLPDGMHPNAAGVAQIVQRILPHVVKLTNGET